MLNNLIIVNIIIGLFILVNTMIILGSAKNGYSKGRVADEELTKCKSLGMKVIVSFLIIVNLEILSVIVFQYI